MEVEKLIEVVCLALVGVARKAEDHSGRFDDTLKNSVKGNRFHVSFCQTLRSMWADDRSARYVPTNNLDAEFLIEASSGWGQSRTARTKLNVCMNCLSNLNYRNSRTYFARRKAFQNFSLTEFFTDYSTCFEYPASGLRENSKVGYTDGWPERQTENKRGEHSQCYNCN